MPEPLALIINAGGESRRMGRPKALLPMPGSGEPLLRYILRQLKPLIRGEVIVVANDPGLIAALELGAAARSIPDQFADGGPLGGMVTGLRACDGWAILVACDMPLINPALFRLMMTWTAEGATEMGGHWQAIVPAINGIAQPFHALYHRHVLPAMEQKVAAGERRAASFLGDVPTRWVTEGELRPLDPELRSFVNVNTPQEWAAVCRLLQA